MRIVPFDDSKPIRMIVLKTLHHAGFRDHTFSEAADGVEALAAIRADEPDCVIANWNMRSSQAAQGIAQHRLRGPLRLRHVGIERSGGRCSLGAAPVMMNPGCVDDSVKARELDDTLSENLYEVLNVLSAVFPKNGARRLNFRELARCTALAGDEMAVLAKPGRRLDRDIAVTGDREGTMSVLSR